MCLRFVFLLVLRLSARLRLAVRSEAWKDAEIPLPYHRLSVLQRQQPGQVRLSWVARALTAALPPPIPRARHVLLHLPGEYGAQLWQRHMISGARRLESLGRRAEQAGMPADVFDVCAALIGGLARRPDTRGLPDLLLLATRCAVGAGIRGVDVPGLAASAALPKRVAAEAARFKDIILCSDTDRDAAHGPTPDTAARGPAPGRSNVS